MLPTPFPRPKSDQVTEEFGQGTSQLCNLRQAAYPLRASVSPSIQQGSHNNAYLPGQRERCKAAGSWPALVTAEPSQVFRVHQPKSTHFQPDSQNLLWLGLPSPPVGSSQCQTSGPPKDSLCSPSSRHPAALSTCSGSVAKFKGHILSLVSLPPLLRAAQSLAREATQSTNTQRSLPPAL